MKSFEHASATTPGEALAHLGRDERHRVIAGGTDLVPLMQEAIEAPTRLVDVKGIEALRGVRYDQHGGLRLGALVTLDQMEMSEIVQRLYPTLWAAVREAATPQLRNVATIGGNLCQRSRCWYFRGPFLCWLKGGEVCYAEQGDNRHHAIFGGGPCHSVHASDLAIALVALDAQLRVRGQQGERLAPVERFILNPNQHDRREHDLQPGELIVEVRVPTPEPGSRGVFHKVMDRRAWAFALASVAVQATVEDGRLRRLAIVLGGVAPTPWRPPLDGAIIGEELTPDLARRIAREVVQAARPLSHNRYKVTLVRNLIERALVQVAEG